MSTRRALVIGAGIGGLAAAIALRRAGVDVAVYERAPALREVGAGISLWANAIQALSILGLDDRIRAASIAYEVGGLRSHDDAVLSTIAAAPAQLFKVQVIVLHRADLQGALIGALPRDVVHLGMECASVEPGEQAVTVRFPGGRSDRADLVVGADGLNSVVRAALFGPQPPRYAGCTAWRAVVEFPDPIRAT